MERGSFLANQLLIELDVLLDAEGVLLLERGEVAEGHFNPNKPLSKPENCTFDFPSKLILAPPASIGTNLEASGAFEFQSSP